MDDNKISKLKALSELYKAGILSKEELEIEKKKLLGDSNKDKAPETRNEESNSSSFSEKNDENIEIQHPSLNEDSNNEQTEQTEEFNSRSLSNWIVENKTKFYYLTASLLILIGIGIFIGLYQHRENQIAFAKEREQNRLDSIAEVERLMAKHIEDSIRHDFDIRNFTSPDLDLFDLHGKVKSVKLLVNKFYDYLPYSLATYNLKFDDKGKCLNLKESINKWYNDNSPVSIERNEDGFIKEFVLNNDWGQAAWFEWNGRKLKAYSTGQTNVGHSGYSYDVTYNSENFVVSVYCEGGGGQMSKESTTKFFDFKMDKYGNWTKCQYRTEETIYTFDENTEINEGWLTREIQYYN